MMNGHGLLHPLSSFQDLALDQVGPQDLALDQQVSNCSCDMHPKVTVLLDFLPICNLPLVPSWVLAVVIGLVGGSRFHRLGPSVPGSLTYSITFYMYAAMITSGLFVHCLFLVECGAAPSSKSYDVVGYIDASLTSCIAISFFFNGLVDLRLIPERSVLTLVAMVLTYAGVFYAYFDHLIDAVTLYKDSVFIGCSLYLLCQLVLLCRSSLCSLLYLTAAGTVGGASFLLFSQFSCFLCTALGAWSVEGVWYYGSDVTMFFILLYGLSTRQPLTVAGVQVAGDMSTHSGRNNSKTDGLVVSIRNGNVKIHGNNYQNTVASTL